MAQLSARVAELESAGEDDSECGPGDDAELSET
jgi:hypothetical protein